MEYFETLFSNNEEYTACALTGHRELGEDFDEKKLENAVEEMIKRGVKRFYNGGALGFDLVAAETVLKCKKNSEIKLIMCVPFYGQEKRYSAQDKARYARILKEADEVVTLAEHYYKGCLLRRNDYMIEHADCMIAYLKSEKGGTAYTVKKGRKKFTEGAILYI